MEWKNILSNEIVENSPMPTNFYMELSFLSSSSFFRRLQDKAQVFPSEQGDFSRTRLTHSIEAMVTAEIIGNKVKNFLIEKIKGKFESNSKDYNFGDYYNDYQMYSKLPIILKTAALIHDLGNPPFGHIGEDVISEWFRDNLKKFYIGKKKYCITTNKSNSYNGKTLEKSLPKVQREDLKNFEGNAQLLRILNKLIKKNPYKGYSVALYSTVRKYTYSSIEKRNDKEIEKHKIGYFDSEKELINRIELLVGNNHKRTPLAFLLEAADDISYLTSDIEDALKKKIIDRKDFIRYLKRMTTLTGFDKNYQSTYDRIITNLIDLEKTTNDFGSSFKQFISDKMISCVVSTFERNIDDILAGKYSKELLKDSELGFLAKRLSDLLKYEVYHCREIAIQKSKVYEILNTLLDNFVPASFSCNKTKSTKTDSKNDIVCQLISENYREQTKNKILEIRSSGLKEEKEMAAVAYECLRLAVDEISGMTDLYAEQIYNTLKGIR